jgi:secreted Zn-dependent insulinase-like peptidase
MQSIRKPDIDEREYRLITLRNNLEAMIISDPKANQCMISLVVALARRARGPNR